MNLKVILTPFQRFFKVESWSGIMLFGATLIALVWANSPWGAAYEAIWQYEIGFSFADFELKKPLILWINDGLMAVFFFVIGLEIKRELRIGELSSLRKASLPFLSAIGGMLVPLGVFLLLNQSEDTQAGWGIPMATDIAFTLAILKLLGNRIPLSLKIFLTAFAIVDDLGAVLIIAVFYSKGISWALVGIALLPLLGLALLSYRGIFVKWLTVIVGIVIWVLFLKSGIHPTIAGVLLAFTVPIRQKVNAQVYTSKLAGIAQRISATEQAESPILSNTQLNQIDELEVLTDKFHSPLQQLEHRLHPWVAYMIMPVFALANAGIHLGLDTEWDMTLIISITMALILGKLIGVAGMAWLGVKLKIAALPDQVNAWQIVGVAILAGVGFTMSIFIANLAFADKMVYIDSAKVGILLGSVLAGVIGYLILRFAKKSEG